MKGSINLPLKESLEAIRNGHDLSSILIINDEGLEMAHAGNLPEEGFTPYLPMAFETARRMASAGGFGEPLCNALILEDGKMLIMHQTDVAERAIYLSLLCKKVPKGLRDILHQIKVEIGRALGE